MRDSPPEEARAWAGPQESSSSTLRPSLSRCHAVQAPNTPAPITITSRRPACTADPPCWSRSAASDFTVDAPAAAAIPVSKVRRDKCKEFGILSFSLFGIRYSYSGAAIIDRGAEQRNDEPELCMRRRQRAAAVQDGRDRAGGSS